MGPDLGVRACVRTLSPPNPGIYHGNSRRATKDKDQISGLATHVRHACGTMCMSRNRIILVTAGIMLSLFLASMESTVVATAMPTIVGQLGGLEHYSWVFSALMLASTNAVPLYGT